MVAALRGFYACLLLTSNVSGMTLSRGNLLRRLVGVAAAVATIARPSVAFSASQVSKVSSATGSPASTKTVAYKGFNLPIEDYGVDVPVACWFPTTSEVSTSSSLTYSHRISVRRIGQLLAGWNFIPDFASKSFELAPTNSVISSDPPTDPSKVVFLCHGYLGSRFDLSDLAERLAGEGFVCLAAEFPESLAASYDRVEGLDRAVIMDRLVSTLGKWGIQPSRFGIVGHSLGCGTVLQTGDTSWTRVCIAGFPRQRDGTPVAGDLLFLASLNDGTVKLFGGMDLPTDFSVLQEDQLPAKIPKRSALIFDRPDAPNHISFLSEGVNDAMIEFLSPLLPVAQALSIPVLDFDRYQTSRDSIPTAQVVHPIIVQYLREQMDL